MKNLLTLIFILSSFVIYAQEENNITIDSITGEIIVNNDFKIPSEYTNGQPCNHFPGWYVVELNGKCGIIDKNNKILLPIEYEYDKVNSNPFNVDGNTAYFDSSDIIILKKNGKYGAINSSLKIAIPFEYDFMSSFYYMASSHFIAQKGNNYMIIDKDEKILTKNKYIDFADFYTIDDNGHVFAIFKTEGNKFVFVDKDGNEYPNAIIKTETGNDTIAKRIQNIRYKGKFAAIDYLGNIIGEGYDKMSFFSQSRTNYLISYAVVGKADKYGILRSDGKEVVNLLYGYIDTYDIKDKVAIVGNIDKYGIVDINTGKELIPVINDFIYVHADLCYVKKDNKCALMKTNGEYITDFIFDDFQFYEADLFGAKQNGKWGYVDSTGKVIIPFQFEITNGFFTSNIIAQQKGGKWGFINKKGETVIPFKYDKAECFYNKSYAEIMLNGKKGWVDKAGNETWE